MYFDKEEFLILGKILLLEFIFNNYPINDNCYLIEDDNLNKVLPYLFYKNEWFGNVAFDKKELNQEYNNLIEQFKKINKENN